MRLRSIMFMTAVLAAVFATLPAHASGGVLSVPDAGFGPIEESGMTNPAGMSAIELELARYQVERRFIELGRDPVEARTLVRQLTEADLLVLGANPGMMQEAGGEDSQTRNFLLALVFVAAFFLVLAATDGSFVQG